MIPSPPSAPPAAPAGSRSPGARAGAWSALGEAARPAAATEASLPPCRRGGVGPAYLCDDALVAEHHVAPPQRQLLQALATSSAEEGEVGVKAGGSGAAAGGCRLPWATRAGQATPRAEGSQQNIQ